MFVKTKILKREKQIYIHIGLPKTGTTTIQKSLYQNQDIFLKNNILIPDIGKSHMNTGSTVHHNLYWELTGNRNFRKNLGTWDDLIKKINISNNEKIIITSELFFSLPQREINKIKNYFFDYSVHIIVYLRRQDLFFQSIWSQLIKAGYRDDYYLDFHDWLEDRMLSKQSDFDVILEKWSKVFGTKSIIVRILEKSQIEGTLFNDFLTACDIQYKADYVISRDANISPGIKTLVLIQEIKKRLKCTSNTNARQRLYSSLRRYGEKRGWDNEKANLIDMEMYKKITERYREGNQRVAHKYFNRNQLFLDTFKEKEITTFYLKDFKSEELFDMFGLFAQRFLNERESNQKLENSEADYESIMKQLVPIQASLWWKILNKFRLINKKR
ncbi:MAG: hypothetical protein JW866_05005 [Ignavibacteriales bacterium]|nr:hypothetical protein [Ignavibacteriales bacterium]